MMERVRKSEGINEGINEGITGPQMLYLKWR